MQMNLKTYFKSAALVIVVATMTGCSESNPNSPGVEYMPDMYRSPAIEAYVDYGVVGDDVKPDSLVGISARKPVNGTIPRGFTPYPYPNTFDGYEAAGLNLKNPYPFSEERLANGKEVYGMFCKHCHGDKGDGQGSIVAAGKFPPPPAYNGALKDLPEGKMYHTLQYGKGLMGSHASQLTQEERWNVVYYVQKLQGKELGSAPMNTDSVSTETAMVKPEDKKVEGQH